MCTKNKQFIEKAKKIHGDKYDYSKTQYVNNRTKVTIICPEHGEFEQEANSHIQGKGCKKCGIIKTSFSLDEWKQKARKIHGDKYDYSKTEYKNKRTKVVIVCPKHGEFEQLANNHLRGKGCPQCANSNKKSTASKIISKLNKIHNNKYDYSTIASRKFIAYKDQIVVACPKHGKFSLSLSSHLQNKGCPKCGYKQPTTEELIERFKEIHNDKYDYSKVNYINMHTKIEIICPKHGSFWQKPNDHSMQHGCPRCAVRVSSGHQEIIDYIKSIYNGKMLVNNRKTISPLELDIYLPELGLAFEYHGMYWHSYEINHKCSINEINKNYNKYQECKNQKILLVQIMENEWLEEQEEIKRRIKCYIEDIGLPSNIIDLRYPARNLDESQYKFIPPRRSYYNKRVLWDAGTLIRKNL